VDANVAPAQFALAIVRAVLESPEDRERVIGKIAFALVQDGIEAVQIFGDRNQIQTLENPTAIADFLVKYLESKIAAI
jgi:hypothetical protein